MEIKYNILFFVDKEKLADGNYRPDGKLRVRIRFLSQKIDFNLGCRVDLAKWNNEVQRCKASTTHGKKKIAATAINREIQRYDDLTHEIFKSFEVQDKIPTVDEFRSYMNEALEKPSKVHDKGTEEIKKTFWNHLDDFVLENGKLSSWTKATFNKFKTTKRHLSEFDKDLTFDALTEQKLSEFVEYLLHTAGLRNSTIEKQLNFLKWFLRWAVRKKLTENNAFASFNPRLKSTPRKVIFLTWDELMTLYGLEIPESKKYLERVKDVFLFQCFTSLRYSDVENLKVSDVKKDHIEVTTVKTADSLSIELNKYSRSILDKYKNQAFPDNKVLPVISNQKMNDYLKELGKLAGFNESIRETYYEGNERKDIISYKHQLLSSHAGRRTFICNALTMGIPAETVMKWTGHSDYKAMKPYIDIADKDRQDAMKAFDKRDLTRIDELSNILTNFSKEEIKEALVRLDISY